MRVLVTGGAGFIGSNVIRLLLSHKVKVLCWDNFSHADFKNIEGLDIELIAEDILEERVLKKLPPLDGIIHEAAVTDTTDRDDTKMMRVNYEGMKTLLQYSLKKEIKFVYASSAGVYGNGTYPMKEGQSLQPLNTYAYSKVMCDSLVYKLLKKERSSFIVGLRYFNVYGPGEKHKGKSASMIYQLYLQMINNHAPRLFKFGEQRRDFIYVKDVAQATVKALRLRRSGIINVGTGKASSFNEIVTIINKVIGKSFKPQYFDNPYPSFYQNYTQADTYQMRKLLKFTPQYTLEEGIKDYILNYLQRNPLS